MLEDRRLSRGRDDGGRSRELMQQFSDLHYVVVVHNCVNKVYIAVLQLLVKLRPIPRTSFGQKSDIWRSRQDRVCSTGSSLLDRIGFPRQDLVSSTALVYPTGSVQFRQGGVEAIVNIALERRKSVYDDG